MLKKDTDFRKKLFAMVLPMAFQNLMTALVSASDSLMLGFLTQDALSAVSLATQVTTVFNLFMASMTVGESILAAQYWGKKDTDAVERVLAIVIRMSVAIAFVFFLAALCVPGLLMRIFTSDENLIELGIPYLRIVSWSYLFMSISQVYLCIMKNSDRTLRSTVYGSVAVVMNVGLNAVLIFGLFGIPALGIRGAAIATTIAQGTELLLTLIENMRPNVVRLRPSYLFGRGGELQKDTVRYTTPVLANRLVWGCGVTMISVIMGHLGSDATAANALAAITKNILLCVCHGIGTGGSILIGNELGSGNLERAKEYGSRLCHAALISGTIAGGILFLCSPVILHVAGGSLTPEAKGYLQGMLWICSYYLIGKAINSTVIGGIFCAGGDAKFGFVCDTITMWVVVVPLGLIAAFLLKLPVLAVYFILCLDEFVKLPAVYRHYKKYIWVKDLTVPAEDRK